MIDNQLSLIKKRILLMMVSVGTIAMAVILASGFLTFRIADLEELDDYHLQSNRLATQILLELNGLEHSLQLADLQPSPGKPDSEQAATPNSLSRATMARLYIVEDLIGEIESQQEQFRDPKFDSLVQRLTSSRSTLTALPYNSLSYDFFQQSSLLDMQVAALQLSLLHDQAHTELSDQITAVNRQSFIALAILVLMLVLLGLYVPQRNLSVIGQLMKESSQTLEQLRRSESLVSGIFSTAYEGILTFDEEGRIHTCNKAAHALFAYTDCEIQCRRIRDMFCMGSDSRDSSREFFEALTSHDFGDRTYELLGVRSDGSNFPAQISVSKIESESAPRFSVFVRDLTDARKAESELRDLEIQLHHVQKMESIGVLAGGIAHDFNNLLVSVMGHAELAKLKLSAGSAAVENIEGIESAAERAAELCNQLLAYSGKGSFKIESADVNTLIREVDKLVRVSIPKKINLDYMLDENLPAIDVDKSQFSQILMNLLVNASDAMGDETGTISVRSNRLDMIESTIRSLTNPGEMQAGEYIRISIQDEGTGMEASIAKRIFEPFFTTKFTGRGLGLSAVLGIVRSHKGGISVNSTPGKGTEFQLFFPVSKDQQSTEHSSRNKSFTGAIRKGCVLLVDDEPNVRTVGELLLTSLGFECLGAEDGLEAVETYKQRGKEIDLVLLDLTMPRMSGDEALKELKKINSSVRVIVSSGYAEQEASGIISDVSNTLFLQKPFRLAELKQKIDELLQ